uniref:C1q domain-containing protein n=1 Tax=Echeneis naucrates TaxID=173247 RepID=A0A665UQI8_ECHNA
IRPLLMCVRGLVGPKGNQGDMGLIGQPGPCSPAIQSAFSACVNESFPQENMPIPFPHVVTNRQGHFNPLKGMYMAPVNGTYVFSFNLAAPISQSVIDEASAWIKSNIQCI